MCGDFDGCVWVFLPLVYDSIISSVLLSAVILLEHTQLVSRRLTVSFEQKFVYLCNWLVCYRTDTYVLSAASRSIQIGLLNK